MAHESASAIPATHHIRLLFRSAHALLERHRKIVITLAFGFLLLLGVRASRDYGISWDERFYREYGQILFDYIFKKDATLLTHNIKYHGPVLDFLLFLLERGSGFSRGT